MATAGQYDITIEQGATWRLELTWQDSEGAPIDLTAYTARMQVREAYVSSGTWLSLTSASGGGITLGGAAGTVVITATAEQTAAIPVRGNVQAVWDLELAQSGEPVVRLLSGIAYITPEVTR